MMKNFLTNETIYHGIPFFVFEKYPYYTGDSVLNKIHFDFGFVKLVSRVKNCIYDTEKLKQTTEYHNGESIIVSIKKEDESFDLYLFSKNFHSSAVDGLPYLRLSNGDIVDYESAYYFYKKGYRLISRNIAKKDDRMEYVGFSHRAKMLFTLGDMMLFDETWEVSTDHPRYKEWKTEFEKRKKDGTADRIEDVVPFICRGYKQCDCREDLIKSAENFANYVS